MKNFNLLPILFQISRNPTAFESIYNAMQQHLRFGNESLMREFMQDDKNCYYLMCYVCSNNERAASFFNEAPDAISDALLLFMKNVLQQDEEFQPSIDKIRQSLLGYCVLLINNLDKTAIIFKLLDGINDYIVKFLGSHSDQDKIAEIAAAVENIRNAVTGGGALTMLHGVVQICGPLIHSPIYPLYDDFFDCRNESQIQTYFDANPDFYVVYIASGGTRLNRFLTQVDPKYLRLLFDKAVIYLETRQLNVPEQEYEQVLNVLLMLSRLFEDINFAPDEQSWQQALFALMYLNAKIKNEFLVQEAIEPLLIYLIERFDCVDITNDDKGLLDYVTSFNTNEFLQFLFSKRANLIVMGTISNLVVAGNSKFNLAILQQMLSHGSRNDMIEILNREIQYVLANKIFNNEATTKVILQLITWLQHDFAHEDFSSLLVTIERRTPLSYDLVMHVLETFNYASLSKTLDQLQAMPENRIRVLEVVSHCALNNICLSAQFYSKFWCYLARNCTLAAKFAENSEISTTRQLQNFMGTEKVTDPENNPFALAVANKNVYFLKLVTCLFCYLDYKTFESHIVAIVQAMLTDEESIARMQPYKNDLLRIRDRGYSISFAEVVLKAIDEKVATIRPPSFEFGCLPFNLPRRKKNTMQG